MIKPLIYLVALMTLVALTGCSETANTMTTKISTNASTNASTNTLQLNKSQQLKIATFNVSMEARNYAQGDDAVYSNELLKQKLATGNDNQINNIAEILQHTQADIVLLNEFDYIADKAQGIDLFIQNYLKNSQQGAPAQDYPYIYFSSVNTGEPTNFDLDNDGQKGRFKADAYGFGFFPGHYGMVVLSKYPIVTDSVRTFQYFRWADMPGAIRPVDPANGEFWYNDEEWPQLRLSSKSHWDIPVMVNGKILHVLASHPTPPVFDGPEDRNGARNHDEIRLWTDYISPDKSRYIYDDKGVKGGLAANSQFVILGDQNASVTAGDAKLGGIGGLLDSPRVNSSYIPTSKGGAEHKADDANGKYNTASWGMRADYVLPSSNIKVIDGGVFWPTEQSALFRLIKDRQASSDHRLVWLQVEL